MLFTPTEPTSGLWMVDCAVEIGEGRGVTLVEEYHEGEEVRLEGGVRLG